VSASRPERICVFAGSSDGNRPEYREAARALGRELAERGIGLVYGGSGRGLMGAAADAALAAGGEDDPLGAMLDATVSEGFMAAEYREILIFDPSPAALLDRL
jgi:uncharacterized protein (TIGR00730 family)